MMYNSNKKWIAMFSQSGNELTQLSELLNRWPDCIVTNRQDLVGVNEKLQRKIFRGEIKIVFLPRWPDYTDYLKVADTLGYSILNEKWRDDVIITLHGYLRILPRELCDKFKIYNGHPGLISEYPELKGFDPQKRTWENKENYSHVGCVIHRVIPELDSGEIVSKAKLSNEFKSLGNLYAALHSTSINLWYDFMKGEIGHKVYALTGAQSTGKTTILNFLKHKKPEFLYVDEITRKLANEGYAINNTDDDYNKLQTLICESHIKNLQIGKNSFLDRCIFDGYIYTKYLYNHNKVNKQTLEFAEELFCFYHDKYDKIFYTDPKDVKLIDDGVRSNDPNFRDEIISIYNEINIENYSNVIKISGTVEERYNQILEHIK